MHATDVPPLSAPRLLTCPWRASWRASRGPRRGVAGGGAGRLDVPAALAQRVQAELIGDLGRVHRIGQVLLVGEDEEDGLAELVLVEHAVELVARLAHAVAIVRVHTKITPCVFW